MPAIQRVRLTDFTAVHTIESPLTAKIHVCYMNEDEIEKDGVGDGEDGDTHSILTLPHVTLDGLWEVKLGKERRTAGALERSDSSILPTTKTNNLPLVASLLPPLRSSQSLHYQKPLKSRLLSYASVSLTASNLGINPSICAFNRVVLLHGPPGTGKTTLARGVAHKMAIRHGSKYSRCQLVEIHSHSLFSKWFSESGKKITQLFDRVEEECEVRTDEGGEGRLERNRQHHIAHPPKLTTFRLLRFAPSPLAHRRVVTPWSWC